MAERIYDFTVKGNDGKEVSFKDFEGKVLLLVNTASKCGFTPQYEWLEALYKKYGGKGLVVVGFPCDQFAHQEPGNDEEIASFCKLNYGVTFPLMAKIEVNGEGAHPLFRLLRKRAPGLFGNGVKWNFTKFLVARHGIKVKRFAPTVTPERLERHIERELGR